MGNGGAGDKRVGKLQLNVHGTMDGDDKCL